MPFNNRHAPLDSPHLTGEGTSTIPGVNDDSNRIATMRNVQALARRPAPVNQPIDLTGDLRGRGTLSIRATVLGLQGRPLTSDPPSDTEVYVWSQAGHVWQLIPACQLGQQAAGQDGQVQGSDGNGNLIALPSMSGDMTWNTTTGIATLKDTGVIPGSYPAANVWVDSKGRLLMVTSGVLAGTIPDAPSDGIFYGRHNAGWSSVAPLVSPAFTGDPTAPTPATGDNDTSIATTAFVKAQNYVAADQASLGLTAL